MIKKWQFILLILFVNLAQASELEVVKLSPKPIIVDRDWNYFKSVACDSLTQVKVVSPRENQLLDKRKKSCLQRYKAFMSKPLDQ